MKWFISKNQLPEKGERVLLVTVWGIQICYLNLQNQWVTPYGICNIGEQDYWMHLPDLPKQPHPIPNTP